MSSRRRMFFVEDILKAIERIRAYVGNTSFEEFRRNDLLLAAVERKFIVIGEAVRHIPNEITSSYPSIPWRQMADMRNLIAHVYWELIRRICGTPSIRTYLLSFPCWKRSLKKTPTDFSGIPTHGHSTRAPVVPSLKTSWMYYFAGPSGCIGCVPLLSAKRKMTTAFRSPLGTTDSLTLNTAFPLT